MLLASLVLVILLGLGSRIYSGPADGWINALGGALYVIFWTLLGGLLLPRAPTRYIAIGALLLTCLVEFSQLWDVPLLQALRATLPGRLVLGTTFVPWDFPPYFVGALLGYFWLRHFRTAR